MPDAIISEQAVYNRTVQRLEGAALDVVKLPVDSDRWRPGPATVPPVMGEHTDEVLGKVLGLDRERIDTLVDGGVVARAETTR